MIQDGFMYFAVLVLAAGLLVGAQKLTKWKFFEYVPPVVLLYLFGMLGCTFKLWDTGATKAAYSALRNPILYAMIFVMLLRCDIRQILKLGPKMLLGFFTATITIAAGFFITYAAMHPLLGEGAWQRVFTERPAEFTKEEKRAWLDTMEGVTLGSDAFFPFSDNIDRAYKSGVKYVAEPGGSVRDDLVIERCDDYGMVMVFTGIRLFHH